MRTLDLHAPVTGRPLRRWRPLLVLLALIASSLGLARSSAVADSSLPLAHVRLTLETTSDWSTATLHGVKVVSWRTVESSAGDKVHVGGAALTVAGGAPSSATVEFLVEVVGPSRLTLDKGYDGVSTALVDRTGADPGPVARLVNDLQLGRDQTAAMDVASGDLVGSGVPVPVIDDRQLTLAFYYPWWTDHSMQANPLRDRPASAWRTDQPGDVETMVSQAASAGVDGFLVSWSGEEPAGAELDLLMDRAEARSDFAVAALLELPPLMRSGLLGRKSLDVPAAIEVARAALARADRSSYLRVDGRPVVAAFGAEAVAPADWARLIRALEPWDPFVLADSTRTDLAIDGVYLYDPTAPSATELRTRYAAMYRRTHLDPIVHPTVPARLFAATVAPGKDGTLAQPHGTRLRQGGARYAESWRIALGARPEWILITSWNEWYEGTQISPSTRHGWLALEQTGQWAGQFGS
jgi:hypothetical protein